MSEPEYLSLERIESARELPLDKQVECLLSVIAPMVQAMQDCREAETVESAAAAAGMRQAFRQCSESLCRPLSKDETRMLLEATIIGLCERIGYAV